MQTKSLETLFNGDNTLKEGYETMLDVIMDGFQECSRIIKEKPNKTDFDVKTQGHLVVMTCGHRGRPSRQEEKRISRLLRKSGFIPMLEEIYGLPPGADAEKNEKVNKTKGDQKQQDKETPKYVGAKMFGKLDKQQQPPKPLAKIEEEN